MKKFQDDIPDLPNLPSELTSLIANHTRPSKIPKLCRVSKTILNQCKTPQFWSYYLNSYNIAASQQKLHELLVELARQGDIEFFRYIWYTDIILNRKLLIKERKSLWDSYIAALKFKKIRTANFIYNINFNWINKKVSQELWVKKYDNKFNYQNIFVLKRDFIDIVKDGDIIAFEALYDPNNEINQDTWTDILSFSPNFRILQELVKIVDYQINESIDEKYEDITNLAIQEGNVNLVDGLRKQGFVFGWLYGYYLQSKRVDGDILALRYGNVYEDPDVADAIGFVFGNREIMLKYIKVFPKNKVITVIRSFKILSDNEIINLLKNDCLIPTEVEDWSLELDAEGRDYLLSKIGKDIVMCKNNLQ